MTELRYADTEIVRIFQSRLKDMERESTHKEIAAEMGFAPNMFSGIMNGRVSLPMDRWIDVMVVLRVDPAEFMAAALASYPEAKGWASLRRAMEQSSMSVDGLIDLITTACRERDDTGQSASAERISSARSSSSMSIWEQ